MTQSKIENRKSKTAFVTGGTGFIGSHLVEELLRRGYGEVRCLVRTELKWLEGLDIVPVHGDLSDVEVLWEAVEDVDYVYHTAGLTRAKTWEAFVRGNVTATLNLLGAVKAANPNVRKVLVTSSLAAVGRAEEPVATEEMPLRPVSLYGKSKARMEEALGEPREMPVSFLEALPLVVVRPPSVYGPRDRDIFTFFESVKRGICPVVGKSRHPTLSLVHVRDLVRGMVDAAEHPETVGETYFLGSKAQYSWQEVKEAATQALGRRALTVRVPELLVEPVGALAEGVAGLFGEYPALNRDKAREIRHACKMCSSEKARRELGYRQTVPLDEGVEETIRWYQAEGWL